MNAHPVLVDGVALPFLIKLLIEALLFDHLADIDVFQWDWGFLDEKLGMGCFAGAGRPGNDNDG